MKKIGIITIIDYMNYGNRLQNYATQEVIKSLGFNVETIVNFSIDENIKENIIDKVKRSFQKFNIKYIFRVFKKIRCKFYKTKKEYEIQELNLKKRNNFIQFTKVNIKETEFAIFPNLIPSELDKNFDFFIVGSDQVWNPNFRYGSAIDFITFAPIEKRIAYSASFGISKIPKEYVEKYRIWLREFAYISVREQSGAEIIKNLIDREVTVLLDPTMMLNKEDWLEISKPIEKQQSGAYLLTYFLGEISDDISNWIKSVSKRYDLTTINLGNIIDKTNYIMDPSQFIYYINNCSMICTDSFHGTVFSILFEKPFFVFDRVSKTPSMNSRIDTLLSKFQFEDRKWRKFFEIDDIFDVKFTHVPGILEMEREKAIDYLKNALEK